MRERRNLIAGDPNEVGFFFMLDWEKNALEVWGGFEPPHSGFANHGLNHLATTPKSYVVENGLFPPFPQAKNLRARKKKTPAVRGERGNGGRFGERHFSAMP